MDKKRQSRAPIITAVIFLLLPVLYLGSYLVLVQRGRHFVPDPKNGYVRVWFDGTKTTGRFEHYRLGDKACEKLFWPLEQLDRKVWPEIWDRRPIRFESQSFGPANPTD